MQCTKRELSNSFFFIILTAPLNLSVPHIVVFHCLRSAAAYAQFDGGIVFQKEKRKNKRYFGKVFVINFGCGGDCNKSHTQTHINITITRNDRHVDTCELEGFHHKMYRRN